MAIPVEQLSDEDLLKEINQSDFSSFSDEELVAEITKTPIQGKTTFERSPLGHRRFGTGAGEALASTLPEGSIQKSQEVGEMARTEVLGPITSGLSTAAFGIPKALTKRFAPEQFESIFPEQTTAGGKTFRLATEVKGLIAGGAASIAGKGASIVAGKLGQAADVGLKAAKGAVSARKKAILIRQGLSGAASGSIFGATQVSSLEGGAEDILKRQATQSVAGGVLGAAFGFGGEILKRAGRGIKKALNSAKKGRVTRIIEREKVSLRSEKLGLKEDRSGELAKQRQADKELLDETTGILKDNVDVLNKGLQVEAEGAAKKFQEKLPGLYRANSKAYGARLDEISDDLVASNQGITFGEADDLLTRTLQDADDALITTGRGREIVQELKNKYSVRFIGGQQPTSLSASRSNADDIIPFKSLIGDLRNAKKALSAGAQSGASRFTQEDVAISLLNKNLGGFVKTKVPEFRDLQEAYTPVINAMKVSSRLFKPFKGEFETKTATGLLKRVGLGKSEAGENALIRAVEEGSEFAPGIGRMTETLRQKGVELAQAKQAIKPVLDRLKQKNVTRIQGIDKKFANRIQNLSNKENFIRGDFVVKEQMVKDEVSRRLIEIGVRKEVVTNIINQRQNFHKLLRTVGLVGAGATGVLGALGIRASLNRN